MFTPAVRTSCWLWLLCAGSAEALHGEGPLTPGTSAASVLERAALLGFCCFLAVHRGSATPEPWPGSAAHSGWDSAAASGCLGSTSKSTLLMHVLTSVVYRG